MDRLKFRAWDKTERKMIMYANIWQNRQPSRKVSTSPSRTGNMLNDIELMQYTGLKDKNGKEIYESDVVERFYPCLGERKQILMTVEFITGCFCTKYKFGSTKPLYLEYDDIIIIGNLHENPELL